MRLLIMASMALLVATANGASDSPLSVDIEPRDEDNYSRASFTLLLPEGVTSPAYILVLVPGFNGNGQGFTKNAAWVQFARKTNGAIVACTFKSLNLRAEGAIHYAAAQHGSGAALEEAIELLGKKASMPALTNLPLAIYGHSAGGQFAYGFTCYNPKRMIGFAAAKGGFYFPEPVEGTSDVPGLMISGQKDMQRRRTAIRRLFETHRAKGAPWCWMEDAHGHGRADTLSVVMPYFEALLQQQAADKEGSVDRSKLQGVSVDLVTGKLLGKSEAWDGNKDIKMGWLPSKGVYEAWAKLDSGAAKYTVSEPPAEKH